MKQTLARLFLFVAIASLAAGQPMIPVNNISPVTSNTLIGGPATGTSGRATTITAGAGISISGGQITATGGGGSAPSNAPYIIKTPVAALTGAQALSLLSSGLMWSTTGTGTITTLTMSGDATINSSGVLTLANTAVTAGSYTSANITVDAKGRITAAANGLGGGGNVTGPGSSTDRAIATWNSTGGIALRNNSGATIDASNNIVTSGNVTGNVGSFTSASFGSFSTGNFTVTGNLLSTSVTDGQIYIGAAGTNVFTKNTITPGANIIVANGPNSITVSATTGGGGGGAGTGLLSGGGVALAPGGGFDITVSSASYAILNTLYSSPMTDLTLSASDPTNPRIDVVAVNTSGAAVIITGTPSATPAKPDVDPSTQLELTFFLVQAASTDLDVDVTDIYLNNAEWTTTASAGTIDPASTNNPYTGALCIEGTTVATGTYVQFVKPAAGTFDMADSDNLVFYIRSKASWANNRLMTISVRDGTNQLGNAVVFDQGLFGFNSANTTTYQQIIIPTALFAANGLSTATTIRITVGGSGGTLGFYIDDVTLQGGVASVTDASRMRWRGNYVASNFYNVNDVVLSSGIQYVAIQAGVGNTPVSSATFWQPSSSASAGTISSLTGDVTASGSGAVAATLATVNSNVGTFGSATAAPAITINAKGLATGASNITITPAIGSITGAGTTGNVPISNGSIFVSSAPTWFGSAIVSGCTTVTANSTGNITFASANANLVITTDNTTKTVTLNATGGGGGGSPGGSTTQVQYNNAGAFGGISGATSDGTNMTFGSGNLRATSPRITTAILDANGEEVIITPATASAINEVTITNAASGSHPMISASGGGTDVRLDLAAKGSDYVTINSFLAGLAFRKSGTIKGVLASSVATNDLVTGSVANDFVLLNYSAGNRLLLGARSGGSDDRIGLAINGTNSSVNYVSVTPDSGVAPLIAAAGTGADLRLDLASKGNNYVTINCTLPGLFMRRSGTLKYGFAPQDATQGPISGATTDEACFVNYANLGYRFSVDSGSSTSLFITSAGQISAEKTTASTSTTTGALVSKGGLGVAGRTSTATLNVGTGTTVASIFANSTALNYGSISGGAEETLTITVTGVATTNTPSIALGWSAALEDGIVVKQAWVSAADTVSVRVANVTLTPIDPASVTCRATVFGF